MLRVIACTSPVMPNQTCGKVCSCVMCAFDLTLQADSYPECPKHIHIFKTVNLVSLWHDCKMIY